MKTWFLEFLESRVCHLFWCSLLGSTRSYSRRIWKFCEHDWTLPRWKQSDWSLVDWGGCFGYKWLLLCLFCFDVYLYIIGPDEIQVKQVEFQPQAMRTGAIPSSLLRCQSLTHLFLESNEFYGDLPSELGRWQHMKILQLSQNQLTGEIPSSLCQMASLEGLLLDENQFRGAVGGKRCFKHL